MGMALNLFLEVQAEAADEFALEASGRDAEVCGSLSNNLILMTYTEVLGSLGLPAPPLRLRIHNEIPLGMGCGSSAAALVAGVMLARHFGQLDWGKNDIFREAARREGHPDNVAACVFGGVVVAGGTGDAVWGVPLTEKVPGLVYLALPKQALSTAEARAVLPATYRRADVVSNLQASSLLVAALVLGRPDLFGTAMQDRLHQPYREPLCPLCSRLQRLRDRSGVQGVALSGAGPGVLVFGGPHLLPEEIREAGGEELGELLEVKAVSGAEYESPATR